MWCSAASSCTRGWRLIRERLPDVVAEVRGRGLLVGLGCTAQRRVHQGLARAGLVTVPAADEVVRLLPPLTITPSELDAGLRS